MDPSSSNSPEPGGTHRALEPKQVFLSHSGAQKEFVVVLWEEVLRSDRSAFLDIDRESLPIGVHFPHYIFDAIKQCKVGVLILSEEFFTCTKWPMLELVALYERRDEPNFTIIPVFLNITRDECRKKENHIRWFSEWCKWGVSEDELEKWKKAMEIFGPTNGLIFRDGMSKCDFQRDIVDEICQWVPAESTWGMCDVQGSEGIYKVIQGKFDATQVSQRYGVRVVGLYGMGGIGKTTACKVLCNKLFSDFCGRVCHGEFKESNELEMLKEVVERLTSTKQDVLENYNIDQCCDQLESAMHKRKVFLAIDNVSVSMADLTMKLLKMRYGEGSIVLVTARTLDVLTSRVGIAECNCMEMPDLVEEDAKSLFLQHSSPVKEVSEECLNKCIKQCYFGKGDGVKSHYHPLALRVLGSQFANVDPMSWVEKLDDLDKFYLFENKEHPIFSILRRNFDGLEFRDQMLFMDAAIFYPVDHNAVLYIGDVDREGDDVKSLKWKEDINIIEWLGMVHGQEVESIKKRLESLRNRSLIENWGDGSRRIGMHDLWIEFAYAEAKGGESRKRAWLYEPVYGAADVRREESRLCGGGWKQLERIYLKGSTVGGGFLKRLNLKGCQRLTVLKVVGVHIESGVLDLERTHCLKSLEIVGFWEQSTTVKNICGLGSVKNLVVMRLSGIDLSSQFIDEVKGLTNLEFLHLPTESVACRLPSKLPELSQLSLLSNVKLCSEVESTISGLNSNLAHLRCLDLSGCGSLTSCPGVDALFALEELYLNDCCSLKELPNLQQLKRLQKLEIRRSSIEEVPGLGDLVALVVFVAERCRSLAVLPNMRKLSKLQILNVDGCDLIKANSGLCDLIALEEFKGAYDLLEFNTDLQNLPKLVTIGVSGWSLHGPPGVFNLANLQDLSIYSCEGVHELGGLLNFSRLQMLELAGCGFQDVSCISHLTTLQDITIDSCDELKGLPDMHRLTRLERLSIFGCLNLREWAGAGVHGFGTLPLLDCLYFSKVPIVELPDLSWFPRLRVLYIDCCKCLERLTSTEPMTALERVSLTSCKSLKEVPDFSHSKLLRSLKLDHSDRVLLSVGEIEKLKAMGPGLKFSWMHDEPSEMEVDLDWSSGGEDGSDGLKISWEHGNEDESLKMEMEVEVEMQRALKLVGVHSESDFVDLSTLKHLKSVEIADASNDVLKSDYGIINLLKNQMGAMTFIQAMDFKDVLPKCQDEAAIVLGFFNAISDDIEFYFKNGEDMAKFMGVGLDHAKVVVKRGIIFEVHEIEREDWKRVWLEVEGGSNLSFKIMKVALPRARRGGMENMQHEDVCNFATSSASSSNGLFQDYPPITSNNTFQIPLLWELSKYFIMGSVIDTLNTKFNVDIFGESSAVSSTEDYPKDGNDTEVTWVQTVLNLFSIGASHSFYSNNGGNGSQEKECEGGNGSGSGGGDDNDPRGISKLNLSEDKFKFSRVTVILLCGGDFKPSLTRIMKESRERLENVTITPQLIFDFTKGEKLKRIQITSKVIFTLGRKCDGFESCGHFGWFHDQIYTSIGPSDKNVRNTVRLEFDFKAEEFVVGKTINKLSRSKDSTRGYETGGQVKGSVGSKHIAQFQVGGHKNQQGIHADHQTNEQSLESICYQTEGGFRIDPKPVMEEALLEYEYVAPYFAITADSIQGEEYRAEFLNQPMCKTQKTQFSGNWIPHEGKAVAMYTLKAERRLREIVTQEIETSGSKLVLPTVQVRSHVASSIFQTYQKELWISYPMTNLVDGQTLQLLEGSHIENHLVGFPNPLADQ